MSDASLDFADGTGQGTEDFAEGLVGDRDPAETMFFYGGIYSGIWTAFAIYGYILLKDNFWIGANTQWFIYHIGTYMPLFMGWLFISFFDGEFMRAVFRALLEITFLGPFFAHWYAIGLLIFSAETVDSDFYDSNLYAWDELSFYLWVAIYGMTTVIEMLVQVTVTPRILEWLDSAKILDNDQENLMAIEF